MKALTSRRSFIVGTAAASAAAVTKAVPKAYAEIASSDIVWDYETDVLVCGCGAGGSSAALASYDAGAEVLVIEKYDWLGGQLRRCGGGIAAANTQVQQALGIEDDPGDFCDYWLTVADGCCDEELVRDFVSNSSSVIDWVIDDLGGQPVDEWALCGGNGGREYDSGPGLNVGISGAYERYGFEPVPRCHWFTKNPDDPIIAEGKVMLYPTAGGTGLWKVFSDNLAVRGINVLTETPLVRLMVSPVTGEIVGAVAHQGGVEIRIKARKGVVVATGNFASNSKLFSNYTGKEWVPGVGGGLGMDLPEDNDGTGFNAVLALGASLKNPFVAGTNASNPDGVSFLCGGISFDTKARPIDVFGKPIPRVYIAGVIGGGMYGWTYPVCGASLGRTLYYGRIAGQEAASLDSWE